MLAQLNPTHIAISMTDLTSSLGGVIALSERLDCKLAWQCRHQDGNLSVSPINKEFLLSTVRSAEVSHA